MTNKQKVLAVYPDAKAIKDTSPYYQDYPFIIVRGEGIFPLETNKLSCIDWFKWTKESEMIFKNKVKILSCLSKTELSAWKSAWEWIKNKTKDNLII
jgi:hypothetical protein